MAFVFFFQAEDGIRDGRVTGVQTCALPISTFASAGSERLTVAYPQWPPYKIVQNGTIGGIDALVLDEIARQIGRASCRERVYISGVAVSANEKENIPQFSILRLVAV